MHIGGVYSMIALLSTMSSFLLASKPSPDTALEGGAGGNASHCACALLSISK